MSWLERPAPSPSETEHLCLPRIFVAELHVQRRIALLAPPLGAHVGEPSLCILDEKIDGTKERQHKEKSPQDLLNQGLTGFSNW